MTNQNNTQKNGKHLIGGIVVLTVGVLFLFRNFDILGPELSHYLFSWKTLLIGIGILNLALANNKVGGIILIAIGTFFWMPEVFDLSVRAGQLFWPVVIIIIGISLLFKKPDDPHFPWKKGRRSRPSHSSYTKTETTGTASAAGSSASSGASHAFAGDEYIDDIALFSGSTKIITSNNFRGGKMTAIFGGSEVNLTRAKLAPGRNILNVFFMFGGSEIIVPSDWNVVLEATPVFGGFSDERYVPKSFQTDSGSESVLIIRGLVIFGGAEIKSY